MPALSCFLLSANRLDLLLTPCSSSLAIKAILCPITDMGSLHLDKWH